MMTETSSTLSPVGKAASPSASDAVMSGGNNPHSSDSSPTNIITNNNSHNNSNDKHHWFERLNAPIQFCILASGVFLFFGMHNYLQEAIMSVEGFHYGVMLGYLEVFGVTVCSFLERQYIARETKRVAPISAYPLLTFCLMSSSSLSNLALNYINFPTKVYVRDILIFCKVISKMTDGLCVHHGETNAYLFQLMTRSTCAMFLFFNEKNLAVT
jgi:hypothetical protein